MVKIGIGSELGLLDWIGEQRWGRRGLEQDRSKRC